jgi:hypothetical protein
MNLIAGVIAMAMGGFAAIWPAHAARLWGSNRLSGLTPGKQTSYLRWYRVFGIVLCLGGALCGLESMGVWNSG